jgi:5-methylcytosine-specific restriction endonuclease McrA
MRLKACAVCGKIHSADIKCWRKDARIDREHKLRQTNKWHTKSLEIRERSHWLCAVCLDKGIINHESLEVHHIEKLRDNPDGLLDDANLICLCTTHHKLADEGKIDVDYLRMLAQMRDELI